MVREYASIDPRLLVAARKRLRMSEEIAAKKMRVSLGRLLEWEQGTAQPTIRQIRIAAHAYRQSLAFFFLPEIPPDLTPKLHDYRRSPQDGEKAVSSSLLMEIRECSVRREIAIEMSQLLGTENMQFSFKADSNESPEIIGERLRRYLGIPVLEQGTWESPRVAFNAWRHAAELGGLLIFQTVGVEVSEMRGFSIARYPLPVVAVNRKDVFVGRIFSLIHEIVHLGLRSSALCDVAEWRSGGIDRVEVLCNHVAGAVLVPAGALKHHEIVRQGLGTRTWNDRAIEGLANYFSISREAIVRRMLIADLTTKEFYEKKRREYSEETRTIRDRKGFVPPSTDSVSRNGPLLTRLILSSMHENLITQNDASDYLGVRMKHFTRIEDQVGIA